MNVYPTDSIEAVSERRWFVGEELIVCKLCQRLAGPTLRFSSSLHTLTQTNQSFGKVDAESEDMLSQGTVTFSQRLFAENSCSRSCSNERSEWEEK